MLLAQVLLSWGEGQLAYLEISQGSLKQAGSARLPADVACLDITPLGGRQAAGLAAVGTWTMQLHLLSLPGLQPIAEVGLSLFSNFMQWAWKDWRWHDVLLTPARWNTCSACLGSIS